MNETAQQYIQRMTAYVDGKEPLAVQAATAKKARATNQRCAYEQIAQAPGP